VFVTGTDTGVGKTLVAAGLLRAAADRGLSTAACKPVAAGCEPGVEGWRNDDALLLMRHQTIGQSYAQINPVALRAAVAPHIAAAEEGVSVSVAQLATHCQRILAAQAGLTVIEGAGGWRVPVNDDETLADLARALALPVVLVVGMRLGCINHALLSAEAIRRDGLTLAGWVANRIDATMPVFDANLATLDARLGAPRLGLVPWLASLDIGAVAACLDLGPVIGGCGPIAN
jgi:dethiobiotin synthetase